MDRAELSDLAFKIIVIDDGVFVLYFVDEELTAK